MLDAQRMNGVSRFLLAHSFPACAHPPLPQDAREALVGRLFGYGALVQSGLLTRSQASPSIDVKTPSGKAGAKGGKGAKAAAAAPGTGVSPADLAACAGCVKALLELGRSRSFLMEAATATLLQLIGRLGPTGAAQLLEQSSELRDAVCVQPAEASPEVSSQDGQGQEGRGNGWTGAAGRRTGWQEWDSGGGEVVKE